MISGKALLAGGSRHQQSYVHGGAMLIYNLIRLANCLLQGFKLTHQPNWEQVGCAQLPGYLEFLRARLSNPLHSKCLQDSLVLCNSRLIFIELYAACLL